MSLFSQKATGSNLTHGQAQLGALRVTEGKAEDYNGTDVRRWHVWQWEPIEVFFDLLQFFPQ